VSPRATMTIYRAAQAFALTSGRDYCIPDDIKYLCAPVFAHRIVTAARCIDQGMEAAQSILDEVLSNIAVPV